MIALADVAVVVSNAKASAKWWTKNLGFSTYTVGGAGHAMLVAPPGDRFVLHLCEGFAPLEPGDTGIAFLTDAMDAMVARMARGAVSSQNLQGKRHGARWQSSPTPTGTSSGSSRRPPPMVRATANSRAPRQKRTSPNRRVRRRKR